MPVHSGRAVPSEQIKAFSLGAARKRHACDLHWIGDHVFFMLYPALLSESEGPYEGSDSEQMQASDVVSTPPQSLSLHTKESCSSFWYLQRFKKRRRRA